MIKKWDVAPAPNEKNPGRHKLLIKGEMKDIFLIVKKLGSVCSRPEKTSGDFDFIIYLSELEIGTMKKLKLVTAELGAPAASASSVAPSPAAAADSFSAEPVPFEAPKPKFKAEPAPEPKVAAAATPAPAPAPRPAARPEPVPEPAPAPRPAPAPVREPEPEPAAPPPSQTERHGMSVPSISTRTKREEPVPAKAAPAPAAAPALQPAGASISARTKNRWSMELPLIPTYSFQTLIAGSHNRFAHAAAMAVVENPGVIYNPLLLFGPPGTGKTHFINSISYGLSSSLGQSSIFVTDGIKFSKGVELAIKEGGLPRLEELFDKVKVLIIDDVHLLMLSEANRKYISKWLNDFVAKNKQIVVSSVFPPKSLAGLEDSVGFQFTQGWMVDLKVPNAQTYRSILNQLLQGMEVKLSEDELNAIFVNSLMPFGDAIDTLEDMKKLEKFVVNAINTSSHAQLLDMLLGFGETPVVGTLYDEDASLAATWQPAAKDTWFKWGIFYPKGMQREAKFALYSLHERARELGLNTEWSQVFLEEYNSDELYGIPFKIGNFAAEHNVNGAIVLGPQPSSAMGAQEAEFRHLTFKIMSSFSVKGAWLPMEKLKSKAAYAKILMDLV